MRWILTYLVLKWFSFLVYSFCAKLERADNFLTSPPGNSLGYWNSITINSYFFLFFTLWNISHVVIESEGSFIFTIDETLELWNHKSRWCSVKRVCSQIKKKIPNLFYTYELKPITRELDKRELFFCIIYMINCDTIFLSHIQMGC